jgi:site-specific DNA-adenine methylase
MNYGLPYMGSKSGICDKICRLLPKADNFYDLFGGGFSISHYMLVHRSRDFKRFHFNEIRPGITELIKDAISGKYNYKTFQPPWVSREEFHKNKETNPYIKLCWSFGNNGTCYIFGEDIEEYKRSLHQAVVFNEFDEAAKKIFGMEKFRDGYDINSRRLLLRSRIKFLHPDKPSGHLEQLQQLQQLQQLERLEQLQQLQQLQQLERLEQLEQLERLEQLEQLEQLQQLQQLELYNTSYENVPIPKNSTVYCDIPYKGTRGYDENYSFDRDAFLDWADACSEPVYISEYDIDDKRFKVVAAISKMSRLSSKSREIKSEKLYVNRAGVR